MYFFIGSYFTQKLKMALLSLSLNLELDIAPGHRPNLGLPIAKELVILFM